VPLARQHGAGETAAEFPGFLDLADRQDPRRTAVEGVRATENARNTSMTTAMRGPRAPPRHGRDTQSAIGLRVRWFTATILALGMKLKSVAVAEV